MTRHCIALSCGAGKLVINGGSVGIRSRVYNTGSGRISFNDVNVAVKLTGGDPGTAAGYWCWPAICANGDQLTINNATIYVENKGGRGIAGSGVSILNGSEVTAIVNTTIENTNYCALLVSLGGLNVENSTLTAKVEDGQGMGISVDGGDIIFQDSTVTAYAAEEERGIYVSPYAGAFTINGGKVNGTGRHGFSYYSSSLFSISGGAQVTAVGTGAGEQSYGLYSGNQTVTVDISGEGTTVEATSPTHHGAYSLGNISISEGAYVKASGNAYYVYSKNDISISDSTLDAGNASENGVWAENTLSITGDSKVTALGIGAAKGFTVEPAAGQIVEVKTGSSEGDAKHLDGSPFDGKTTLSNYPSGTFFYSGTYTHNLTHVAQKGPTCTEDGNIEHWYCSDCESYFSDANGRNEISQADTVDEATGHSKTHYEAVAPTATEPGNIEYWYCFVCDTYFKDEALTIEIIKEQTILAPTGEQEPSKPEESTPTTPSEPPTDTDKPSGNQTGDTTSPETGDDSNIALWIAVLLTAGVGLTGTALYSRKKKYNR